MAARDFVPAVAVLNRALTSEPGCSECHYLLGESYAGLGDTTKAVRELEGYLAAGESQPEAAAAKSALARLGPAAAIAPPAAAAAEVPEPPIAPGAVTTPGAGADAPLPPPT